MHVLHIGHDKVFSQKIKKLIEQNSGDYEYINSAEATAASVFEKKLSLLIIDEDSSSRQLIKALESQESNICRKIIIIADKDAFSSKKYYLGLGIMAYFVKTGFDDDRFINYLKILNERAAAITKLRDFKIAVVDDDKVFLKIIGDFFANHKIKNVSIFTNPKDFFTVANDFNLYFLDIVMPHCDGETLVEYIRRTNKDAVIMMMTSYTNEKSITHCLHIGANDFMLKPIDFSIFMSRIDSCIKRQELDNHLRKKNEQLLQLAIKDDLTQIYNRSYFLNALHKKLKEVRPGDVFSLLMLDIDLFKQVNDTYGHIKGDYVLKEISGLMQEQLRRSDVLCRWGGEEFVILLGNSNERRAFGVAEMIRQRIAGHKLEGMTSITVSIGAVEYALELTEKRNFELLDNSLYLAKASGRNRCICNEEIELFKKNNEIKKIDFTNFFKSGDKCLDEDNKNLFELANAIIEKCLKNTDEGNTDLLEQMIMAFSKKFKVEEQLMQKLKYDKYNEQKQMHKKLLENALKIKDDVSADKETMKNAARFFIEKALIGSLIKNDLDFFSLLRH